MTALTGILAIAFSTYLLTTYLVYEDGPFNVFAVIRFFAGVNVPVNDMDGEPTGTHISNGNPVAEALTCHRCTGLWMGAAMVLLWFQEPTAVLVIGAIGLGVFLMDMTYGAVAEEYD